jgi:hypothetical protein
LKLLLGLWKANEWASASALLQWASAPRDAVALDPLTMAVFAGAGMFQMVYAKHVREKA